MSFDQSFLAPEAERYLQGLATVPYPVMDRMEREVQKEDQPAVGRLTGSALRALAAATSRRRALEVGTNIGYSALWLAAGLKPEGRLDTIEVRAELARRAEANFREAGVGTRATVHVGEALKVLPRLEGPYDIIFLDAVKAEYPQYLDLALPLLAPGGILAADNLLWLGRVWGSSKDGDTQGVREYTRRVHADPRLATTILPVEDGLGVSVLR